ncbi:hypothetical protein SAMN05443247_01457 [Bradyrhizobium erythrophlei]|nr:hypothetical protein SAMN05443247_01457 [Bradyrhizobium erythrophlei]
MVTILHAKASVNWRALIFPGAAQRGYRATARAAQRALAGVGKWILKAAGNASATLAAFVWSEINSIEAKRNRS